MKIVVHSSLQNIFTKIFDKIFLQTTFCNYYIGFNCQTGNQNTKLVCNIDYMDK